MLGRMWHLFLSPLDSCDLHRGDQLLSAQPEVPLGWDSILGHEREERVRAVLQQERHERIVAHLRSTVERRLATVILCVHDGLRSVLHVLRDRREATSTR